MGTWGTDLFDDDAALDVRGAFEAMVESGRSVEEASLHILKVAREEGALEDVDEGPVYWLVLAVLQMERGVLMKEVRDGALKVIEKGLGLEMWEGDPDGLRLRKEMYEGIRGRIVGMK